MRLRQLIWISLLVLFGNSCKKDNIDLMPPEDVVLLETTFSASSITLNWIDPSDTDFSKVEIDVNAILVDIEKGIQQKTFYDLSVGTVYSFNIRTIDISGNKSTGIVVTEKIDYRLSYLGEFEFSSYWWWIEMGESGYSDTVVYVSHIKAIENADSTILIRYRPGSQTQICNGDSIYGAYIQPVLDPDGKLKYPAISKCYNSHFNGVFGGFDTLDFSLGNYSPGGTYTQVIRGIRVK